jgi:hypothetical protein
VQVTTGWAPVVYGKLDGHDVAAVYVNCNDGGGTADAILAYVQVVFISTSDGPKVAALVSPRIQPRGQPPTQLQIAFRGSEIVAHEFFYGSSEGICCPSGRATTIWRYSSEKLVLMNTVVTKKPLSG